MNDLDKYLTIFLIIAVIALTSAGIVNIFQDTNKMNTCLKYYTPKQCVILRKNG